MRTRKLTLLAFAAIATLATSCSNDQLNDIDNKKGIVIKATAGTPQEGADTRLTHNDNTTRMDIVWAADDAFTVYESSTNKTDYTIETSDAGKASATFTGTWDSAPTSEKVYAIYPSQTANDPTYFFLSLNNQTGTLDGLKDFNYMTASTTYNGDGLNFGAFTHQVAIVKLVMTFPSDVTGNAYNVGLSATVLYNRATLYLNNGAFVLSTNGNVTANGPIAIGVDKTLTAYLCLFPGQLTNVKAVATVGYAQYEAQLTDLNIVADNMYTAAVTMTKKLTWTTGNLVANRPNGAKIGAPTDGGLYFQFGSLIGWAGGASGDGTGMPASTTPGYDYKAAGTVVPSGKTIPTSWDDTGKWKGTGTVPATHDPCTYYLGADWRLPTAEEYSALFNKTTTNWAGSGGWSWTDASASSPALAKHPNGLIFPASGSRNYANGNLNLTNNHYWSASTASSNGHCLYFISNKLATGYDRFTKFGYPVRCVQPATN